MTAFHRFFGVWRQLIKLNQVNTQVRLEYVSYCTDEKKRAGSCVSMMTGTFTILLMKCACAISTFFFLRNMNCQNCQNLLLGHHMVSRHSFKITSTSMISTMFIVNGAKQSKNSFVIRSTIFGTGWCYLRTQCCGRWPKTSSHPTNAADTLSRSPLCPLSSTAKIDKVEMRIMSKRPMTSHIGLHRLSTAHILHTDQALAGNWHGLLPQDMIIRP